MSELTGQTTKRARDPEARPVFLSYSEKDRHSADRLASDLEAAGIGVWLDRLLSRTDSPEAFLREGITQAEVVIVLLSPRSVTSRWVAKEIRWALDKDAQMRGLAVIPVVIEDCQPPPSLSGYPPVDLRSNWKAGLSSLIQQVRALKEIDFARLTPSSFENLVADLLSSLGFSVDRQPLTRDVGFDFRASIAARDPFGGEKRETWVVEVKHYRSQRASVASLQQFLGLLLAWTAAPRGLLVTSGQLTSAARSFLEERKADLAVEIRVIEGPELRELVSRHPALVSRYFDGHVNG